MKLALDFLCVCIIVGLLGWVIAALCKSKLARHVFSLFNGVSLIFTMVFSYCVDHGIIFSLFSLLGAAIWFVAFAVETNELIK